MPSLLDKQLLLANRAIELGGDPMDIQSLLSPSLQSMMDVNYSTPDYSQTIPYGQEFAATAPAPPEVTAPTSLEERMARIQQRRAEGNVHSNPLAGLFDAVTGAENPNSEFQTQGLQNAENPLGINAPGPSAGHPIYGQLGISDSPAVSPSVKKAEVPKANSIEELQEIVVGVSRADKSEEEKQVAIKEVVSGSSEGISNVVKNDMANSGATKEELSAWDKFAGEYDIATIGMALLASNDGSSNMASNLGKAMMLGKQAKSKEASDKLATEKGKVEDARKEREVRVKEYDAVTKRLGGTIGGENPEIPKQSAISVVNAFVDDVLTVEWGRDIKMSDKDRASFTADVETMLASPSAAGKTYDQVVRDLWQAKARTKDGGMFGRDEIQYGVN